MIAGRRSLRRVRRMDLDRSKLTPEAVSVTRKQGTTTSRHAFPGAALKGIRLET
jgi:hypothetical protein